jgi:hypothetical protein
MPHLKPESVMIGHSREIPVVDIYAAILVGIDHG